MSNDDNKYVRKSRPVEARKITAENMEDVATWCGGLYFPVGSFKDNKVAYIHVPNIPNTRNETDSQATVGVWVLREDYRKYRILDDRSFNKMYERATKPKTVPSPAQMPRSVAPKPTQVGAVAVTPGTPADGGPKGLTTGTTREVHRSAESGEFVTEATADANPATTVAETVNDNGLTAAEQAEYDRLEAEQEMTERNQAEDEKEALVDSNEMSGVEAPAEGDLVADGLADAVVPGDMIDHEQPEEDSDGTVQLGAPTDEVVEAGSPAMCGVCGSQVVSGVCSNDIEHDVNFVPSGD